MSTEPSPPKRRFLPQPVEISTRTTKRPHHSTPDETVETQTDDMEVETVPPVTKPRKFLPQPIEETVRRSKKKNVEQDEHATADKKQNGTDVPGSTDVTTLPGNSTAKPLPNGRRFAPEPVEMTTRTSRRKFAPEPVETTARSSKDKVTKGKESSPNGRPRRRFAPEPMETTTSRRRRNTEEDLSNDSTTGSMSDESSAPSRRSTGGRKFAPELIETAKGQFRQKKDEPGSPTHGHHSPPSSLKQVHSTDSLEGESRFSAASLAKRQHQEQRRHSYCVPNLPIIESDSSGEESPPSLTDSPSADTEPEHRRLSKIAEGEDVSFTQYVLSLSDRKKLQEQAMAAYINEVPHEPVNHFAVEEEDEDEDLPGRMSASDGRDPRIFRRSSQDELDLELQTMRKHHEQLEQAKKGLQEDTAGASRFSAAALAARHHLHLGGANKAPQTKKKGQDDEYAKIRAAASPPMLGDDIVFPQTISPRMTRCDVDQAPRPRRADSDDEEKPPQDSGTPLWGAKVTVSTKTNDGLWMGLCQKGPNDTSRPNTPIKSGIQTPAFEGPNPFDAAARGTRTPNRRARPWSGMAMLALTPSRSAESEDDFTETIDKKLEREKQIEEEFTNDVITQIYNYLSLGYPSLARGFDEELSKISRISVEELRKEDKAALNTAKGYIGAPEAAGTYEEDELGVVRGCRRWEALRLYVKEWARQSPTFVRDQPAAPTYNYRATGMHTVRAEAWGATVRKGSWAQ